MRISLIAILCVVGGYLSVQAETEVSAKQNNVPGHVESFLQVNCIDCHDGPEGEAGFDLRRVLSNGIDLQDTKLDPPWVRIIDRVTSGEMPPREADQPNVKDRNEFVSQKSVVAKTSEAAESYLRSCTCSSINPIAGRAVFAGYFGNRCTTG